ncbi:MAG: DUF3592 domain-containing protein [Bacteroidota bacterium]
MISKIIPFFLIIAGVYILFRVYSTYDKFSLAERGIETDAVIESKSGDKESLSYSYDIAGKKFINNERVDENIYNNNVIGEKIKILVDNDNPQRSVIKNNKTALSYISFSKKSNTNPIVLKPWIGFVIGLFVTGIGIWRVISANRKTRKA